MLRRLAANGLSSPRRADRVRPRPAPRPLGIPALMMDLEFPENPFESEPAPQPEAGNRTSPVSTPGELRKFPHTNRPFTSRIRSLARRIGCGGGPAGPRIQLRPVTVPDHGTASTRLRARGSALGLGKICITAV